jgi:hypothetical protein
MTDLPLVVDVLLIAGALASALAAIATIAVKALRAVRTIDEHFRRRETDRIEQAASRIVDQAANALGGRLDALAAMVEGIDRRSREDERRRAVALADWELWRAGVDSRLDLVDDELRARSQSR